jgi:hypothetical protein
MSVKKFKFVSPGIFLNEVDNSQLPAVQADIGPIVIGRTSHGPAMRPITVQSPSEFVQVFGNPIPGGASSGDIWRTGNQVGPTYAAYAAMAYLKAGVGPVTMFRVIGEENPAATDDGKAGWDCGGTESTDPAQNCIAFGLFVSPSGSNLSAGPDNTGSLAAVIYTTGSMLALNTDGADSYQYAYLVDSLGASGEFGLLVGESAVDTTKFRFNFNPDSDKFIRNVLNTNPQLTNSSFVNGSSLKLKENKYWLGETFERDLERKGILTGDTRAILLPLFSGSVYHDDHRESFQYAKTGYFFGQMLSSDYASYSIENMTRLFRVIARDGGRWSQDNLKISVENIKASTNKSDPYGTFSLVIRAASDRDNVVRVIEQFTELNLNPSSPNYIARVIGDSYEEYDYELQRVNRYGQYENNSKYVRVEMNSDVENGMLDDRLLPFGVTGPLVYKSVTITEGDTLANSTNPQAVLTLSSSLLYPPLSSDITTPGSWGVPSVDQAGMELKLEYPSTAIRASASAGNLADQRDASFGLQTTIAPESSRYDSGYVDYLWRMPVDVTGEDSVQGVYGNSIVEYSWQVSLDDIVVTGNRPNVYWESGSHQAGTSFTALSGATALLDLGYNSITAPLYGGHDGFDIKEAEPLRNNLLTSKTEINSAPYNTLRRAIDSVRDPEFVECNVMTIPGLTDESLTSHLLDVCEDRGDALAIIDLPNVYTPFTDSTWNFKDRIQNNPATAVTELRNRGINSSYGCTYYPWVQINDTVSNRLLWVPPSVIALGTLANSEAKSDVWFAPAGFNRGGLSDGSAGWPVLNVTKRLTSKDRDALYEANINPIASFPSEGIVVFGQKTLQVTRSALDRINVRRLLILIKKQVSRIAAGVLFDQNTQVTWNRFLGEVEPFLAGVKSGLGLSEYRVILDETTTTPDLVDQNVMYAKIFLKPERAIEFIAVDFVITNSGASFDD